jgi:hypothetical protein
MSRDKNFAATIEQELGSDETVINALAALPAAPRAAHLEQLRANAELRTRFMHEVPSVPVPDVPQLDRWRMERRVFAVGAPGFEHVPLFQFTDDLYVVDAMPQLLKIFRALSDWQIALWFFSPNAWLGDQRPMDLLQRDPDSVIDAAQHAIETLEV